jgi:hypothetical protein
VLDGLTAVSFGAWAGFGGSAGFGGTAGADWLNAARAAANPPAGLAVGSSLGGLDGLGVLCRGELAEGGWLAAAREASKGPPPDGLGPGAADDDARFGLAAADGPGFAAASAAPWLYIASRSRKLAIRLFVTKSLRIDQAVRWTDDPEHWARAERPDSNLTSKWYIHVKNSSSILF